MKPLVVEFSRKQVEKASDAVVGRVSESLLKIAGPDPDARFAVMKMSQRLDITLDAAVENAMNEAANTALGATLDASQQNASDGQLKAVAATSFQGALPSALMANVAPVVTSTVVSMVPDSPVSPAVDLVSGAAAASASGEVAQQSTSTVVKAVTDTVSDSSSAEDHGAAGLAPGALSTPTTPPTTTPTPALTAAPVAALEPSRPATASASSSTDSHTSTVRVADQTPLSTGQPATAQQSGRRALTAHKAPKPVDREKARARGRAEADTRRTTKPAAKKVAAKKAAVKKAAVKKAAPVRTHDGAGKHRGAHAASREDTPRGAGGRHRAIR